MKKSTRFVTLLLALSLSLSLAACGDGSTGGSKNSVAPGLKEYDYLFGSWLACTEDGSHYEAHDLLLNGDGTCIVEQEHGTWAHDDINTSGHLFIVTVDGNEKYKLNMEPGTDGADTTLRLWIRESETSNSYRDLYEANGEILFLKEGGVYPDAPAIHDPAPEGEAEPDGDDSDDLPEFKDETVSCTVSPGVIVDNEDLSLTFTSGKIVPYLSEEARFSFNQMKEELTPEDFQMFLEGNFIDLSIPEEARKIYLTLAFENKTDSDIRLSVTAVTDDGRETVNSVGPDDCRYSGGAIAELETGTKLVELNPYWLVDIFPDYNITSPCKLHVEAVGPNYKVLYEDTITVSWN